MYDAVHKLSIYVKLEMVARAVPDADGLRALMAREVVELILGDVLFSMNGVCGLEDQGWPSHRDFKAIATNTCCK